MEQNVSSGITLGALKADSPRLGLCRKIGGRPRSAVLMNLSNYYLARRDRVVNSSARELNWPDILIATTLIATSFENFESLCTRNSNLDLGWISGAAVGGQR